MLISFIHLIEKYFKEIIKIREKDVLCKDVHSRLFVIAKMPFYITKTSNTRHGKV